MSESNTASGWRPISEFPGDTPFWVDKTIPEILFYDEVLVFGVKSDGNQDPVIEIASTYTGRAAFMVRNNTAPSEYDCDIQPTHWMPLPTPPGAAP